MFARARAVVAKTRPAVVCCLLAWIAPIHAAQQCDHKATSQRDTGSRFEAHDDGTVTDRRSRLMWTRCSAGQSWSGARCVGDVDSLTFGSAQALVDSVNRSGTLFFSDWRLPRAPELASLAERECASPRIDLALFPDTPAELYWTTSTRPAPAEGFVYALSFGNEGIQFIDKEQAVHLRLVRDAR